MLSSDHFIFKKIIEVQQICKPLDILDIDLFYYIRLYADNSAIILANNREWLRHFLLGKEDKQNNKDNLNNGIYLWQHLAKKDGIHTIEEFSEFSQGIQFIEKDSNYIDRFAFANKDNSAAIFSSYLNSLDLLEKFILYFKEKAQHLLQQADQYRIINPTIFRKNDRLIYLHADSKRYLKKRQMFHRALYETTYEQITKRQFECLELFAHGQTAKETAHILNLSNRTVEDHLYKLKKKFNCYTKAQLISVYFSILTSDREHIF